MSRRSTSVFGAPLRGREVDPDAVIQWGCSGKGWNCCVGKGITVGPFDLLGLARETETTPVELINEQIVSFSWYENGSLLGMLARRPYERQQEACVFYHDVTNRDLAALRDGEPELFEALPPKIQHAADSETPQPWRAAGLCGVHDGRPMVCRGFPFSRQPTAPAGDDELPTAEVHEVHRCGTCALSDTTTTARAVLDAEHIQPYWLASDAFDAATRYLRALGLAQLRRDDYTALPVSPEARTELWTGLYVPDSHPEVTARFGDGWLRDGDPERDLQIVQLTIERAFDAAEALVAEHDIDPRTLGIESERPPSRPRLDLLLSPTRVLLPLANGLAHSA